MGQVAEFGLRRRRATAVRGRERPVAAGAFEQHESANCSHRQHDANRTLGKHGQTHRRVHRKCRVPLASEVCQWRARAVRRHWQTALASATPARAVPRLAPHADDKRPSAPWWCKRSASNRALPIGRRRRTSNSTPSPRRPTVPRLPRTAAAPSDKSPGMCRAPAGPTAIGPPIRLCPTARKKSSPANRTVPACRAAIES